MSNLVTVFGGSGFLGRHTVRALAKAGYRIRVAVRRPAGAYFLMPTGTVGQIQAVKCNVGDPDQVASALKGADIAINLTGILFQQGEQSFETLHVEAAKTIARAASGAGVKTLVHVSAIGADRDAPSAYACTKGEGEIALHEAFPAATILRPSVVFGPEDKFFNTFAGLARLSPALPLIGGGHTKFQPVFVGDVAQAILRAIQDPAARGETYELGGPSVYEFKALMRILLHEIGRKRLLVPIPFFAASIKAFFLQMSAIVGIAPLLTTDQVTLLKSDNVVHDGQPGFAELGIRPVALEAVLASYIWRFRPRGQYDEITPGRAPAQP
jgi:uncharacterized protein YbjT (DUF2867 family)